MHRRFTAVETAALREAVSHLDQRAMRDGLGGGEYWHCSPAARLREMLGEASPYVLDFPTGAMG